ncbi:hypothetical protein Q8A67_003432 [Cirrhinus molitorella]|uniref:G-protein coupled receptors family 1 profile domain-containing protein n=1 Tax=Cirrhinus molitorella TaxID=172907 RepID=A0AA88Q350_9TELE|nr:hypothetical protein Q8A67_003432 [Cirrhinus molitorella]
MDQNISDNSSFARTSVDELVSSTVLGLCCALGVPGNIAVLVMLTQHLKEDSFTPKLMLSLAISDLLSLITLPVWIYALLNGWVFGQGLCKLFSYVVYWSLYSSVLSVTLLSMQSMLCFYFRLHQRISQSASFRSHRLTKLAVRIVVTFFIFSTPCFINNLILMAVPWESDVGNSITGALFFINSCVNPFLYAFSARALRRKRKQHSDQLQQYQDETE